MPWQVSYAAYAESDSAELQTDVMRFMAILALCLVAIFAIVQSIPATPAALAQQSPAAPRAAHEPGAPVAEQHRAVAPVVSAAGPLPAAPVELQRAEPRSPEKPVAPVRLRRASPTLPQPTPRAAPVAASRPAPAPVAQTPRNRPPAPAPATPAEQGLSLRFESDAVLRSLVARGLVDLYAISDDTFYEMTVSGSDVGFQPGAAPAQYHEMIDATVPYDVRRSFGARAAQVTWGVTLPAATSQQLARFVRTRYNGSLVITSDAQLALNGHGGA